MCFGAGQQDSSGYSLQRRDGRAIKKMMPKATKVGADGVVSPRNVFGMRFETSHLK